MTDEALWELIRTAMGYHWLGYDIVQILGVPVVVWVWWRFRKLFLLLLLVSHLLSVLYGVLTTFCGPWSTTLEAVTGEIIYSCLLVTRLLSFVLCIIWLWKTRTSQQHARQVSPEAVPSASPDEPSA